METKSSEVQVIMKEEEEEDLINSTITHLEAYYPISDSNFGDVYETIYKNVVQRFIARKTIETLQPVGFRPGTRPEFMLKVMELFILKTGPMTDSLILKAVKRLQETEEHEIVTIPRYEDGQSVEKRPKPSPEHKEKMPHKRY